MKRITRIIYESELTTADQIEAFAGLIASEEPTEVDLIGFDRDGVIYPGGALVVFTGVRRLVSPKGGHRYVDVDARLLGADGQAPLNIKPIINRGNHVKVSFAYVDHSGTVEGQWGLTTRDDHNEMHTIGNSGLLAVDA